MQLTNEELTLACECVYDTIDTITKQWDATGLPVEMKKQFLKQYQTLYLKLFNELATRIVSN